MNGKKKISILTAALIIAILAGVLLYSVLAASPSEYTVLVKYYDSVQAHYRLVYPDGSVWDDTTDIPIGGIGKIGATPPSGGLTDVLAQQAYCIDPFVPFSKAPGTQRANIGPAVVENGYIETSALYPGVPNYAATVGETWGVTTTDWRGGYYAVPPWVMSDALKDNAAAVWWLVYNGYRGDFRAHGMDNTESQESLDRINLAYGGAVGGAYIDKTIAVMATKIAIWRVLTNDDASVFKLIGAGSSAKFDDDRQKVFSDLVDAFVRDAKAANAGSPPIGSINDYTKLTLTIDKTHMLATDAADKDKVFAYYGPVLLNAEVENPGSADVDGKEVNVYLTATGPFSEGVGFASKSGTVYTDLPVKEFPNSGGERLQCVSRTFTKDNICSIDDVFLKIPISRIDALGPELVPNELLLVRAMACAPEIEVAAGTPVPIAALSGDGVQNWYVAQAFVGAAVRGAQISMYAEAAVRTQENFDGEITINKNLAEANTADAGRRFQFALLYGASPYLSAATQVDFDFHNISPAANRIGDTNNFWLASDGTVRITNLPEHFFYWLVELGDGMGDFKAPLYNVRSGIPEAGITFPARAVAISSPVSGFRTCHIRLDAASARAEIFVTNTKEGERAVQTGDDRNIILPVAVISFGCSALPAPRFIAGN